MPFVIGKSILGSVAAGSTGGGTPVVSNPPTAGFKNANLQYTLAAASPIHNVTVSNVNNDPNGAYTLDIRGFLVVHSNPEHVHPVAMSMYVGPGGVQKLGFQQEIDLLGIESLAVRNKIDIFISPQVNSVTYSLTFQQRNLSVHDPNALYLTNTVIAGRTVTLLP